MPTTHRASLTHDDADGSWLVDFPGLPGCHTYGATPEEARTNAAEALHAWLDDDTAEVEIVEG